RAPHHAGSTAKLARAPRKPRSVLPSWPFSSSKWRETGTLHRGTSHAESSRYEAHLAPLLPMRFLSRPRFPFASAVASLAVATLWTGSAAAQDADSDGRSWREPRQYETPQRFAFELRFGPYRPDIDDPFPGQKPYENVFGTDHRVAVGFEFDWQAMRIPFV